MQRKRSPLITSVNVLRTTAAGITLLSLAGMTAFAGGHLRNTAAPLQPVAAATVAPAAATTTGTTGRLQLSRGIAVSTARPITITHHS